MAISSQQSVVSKEAFVLQRHPLEIGSNPVVRNIVEGGYKQRPSKSKRTLTARKN